MLKFFATLKFKHLLIKKNLKTNLILVLLLLSALSCKKKPSANPIDDLPPITQTGANTFGCLINGEVFLPKKKKATDFSSGPALQCYYQYLNADFNSIKGYFFGLSATDFTRTPYKTIYVQTINKVLALGEYDLGPARIEKTVGAEFNMLGFGDSSATYSIKEDAKGKLKITRFDIVNQIVSGTFWFNAVNEKGEKVEIREGRFDMRFTR